MENTRNTARGEDKGLKNGIVSTACCRTSLHIEETESCIYRASLVCSLPPNSFFRILTSENHESHAIARAFIVVCSAYFLQIYPHFLPVEVGSTPLSIRLRISNTSGGSRLVLNAQVTRGQVLCYGPCSEHVAELYYVGRSFQLRDMLSDRLRRFRP